MNCTNPKLIKGDYGSQIGSRGFYVPCGQCISCRIARSAEWAIRIGHELEGKDGVFITLTYDEKNRPYTLVKKDLQNFIKRLRKNMEYYKIGKYYHQRNLKYYATGEYGDKSGREHYHAIIIGLKMDDMELYKIGKYYHSKKLERLWKYGWNSVDEVNETTINYVTKYITKKLNGELAEKIYGDKLPPFNLMSKKIGLKWMEKNKKQLLENKQITKNGDKIIMPRYYKKKLELDYTKEGVIAEQKTTDYFIQKTGLQLTEGAVEWLKQRSREQSDRTVRARLALKNKSGL